MSVKASRLWSFLYAALAILFFMPAAQADKRIALVIGNSNYKNAGLLANPAHDAAAIAALLRAAGFASVEVRRDLGIAEMRKALGDFSEAAQDADVALLFYAGHGIEVDGTNYLIPVDARLARDFDVEDEAISLDRVLRAIERAKRLRFVMLDACRDNPFMQTMRRTSRSVGRGLARMESTAPDTLVAFSTEAGTVAADGDTQTSPFTSALLRHLATPGLDVRIAFGRVRDDVMKSTGNRQRPFIYGSLGGATLAISEAPADVAPQGTPVATVPPFVPPDPCVGAEAHWKSTEAVGSRAAYQDHIARFGSCMFAGLAAAQIATIDRDDKALADAEARKHAEANMRRLPAEMEQPAPRKAADAERKRIASLPPQTEKPPRQAGLDGTWTIRRSTTEVCGTKGSVFTIRISGGVVRGPKGSGSVSPSGAFHFPGAANNFSGTLRGNSGGGTYSGRCSGTFTASRN